MLIVKSFYIILRLTFVVFSLYLMGDAFSRWDGFSYYASLAEFLPSVALASILWSIIAVIAAFIVWMLLLVFVWLCKALGLRISMEQSMLYLGVFILLGAFVWGGKKLFWPHMQTSVQLKFIVMLCAGLVSFYTVWLIRNKAESCIASVNDRISPLVWLFGIIVFIFAPFVILHTWDRGASESVSYEAIQHSDTERNRPNILLVTFDALASRQMSLYGYHRETTPFISRWAQHATVFSSAEAGSNFTTPAVANLMTGKRVWTHQTYHVDGMKPVKSTTESLPAVLKEYGYFNIALVVNPFASASALGMTNSFDIAPSINEFGETASLFGWKFGVIDRMLYRFFGEKIRLHNWIFKNDFIFSRFLNLVSRNISQTTVPPSKAFSRFLDIVDNKLQKPFFAWIHVFPPHDPYLPPDKYAGVFNSSRELRSYKGQEKLIEESYEYLFSFRSYPEEMQPAVNLMRDYYDEFVRYIDKEFEVFISEFNKRRIENTIIILSADHGESFEKGYFTHGGPYLYEQVTNVPLIIKKTGQKKGKVLDPLVEQIDIPATILELADIQKPSWMEGRSLVPFMNGTRLPTRPVFSMNFQENRSRGHQISKGSIAVWEDDYKLIHYLEKNKSLLFNLSEDPDELNNIFDGEVDIGQRLLGVIKDNIERVNGNIKNRK